MTTATEVPVAKYVELARARHLADLDKAQNDPQYPFYFDFDAGWRVVEFASRFLKHHKGEWAGKPFDLEDWQINDIILPIFGWKRKDDHTRRYRIAYVEVPRKNGKSEIAAFVGNYLFLGDGEPGAEVYSSATKKDQARIVWTAAVNQIEGNDELSHIKAYRTSLYDPITRSKFEPLAADANSLDGLNPHGNIIDELHAHKTREVWDVMQTALAARRQPLTFAITTAGVYEPESIGWELHARATNILEGAFEADDFFAYICSAEKDDDPHVEETWRKANPNYGISVKPLYIESQSTAAKQSTSFVNTFLRLHLGIWTNQVNRWISLDDWNKCDYEPPEQEPGIATICYGGLDLSSTTDLTAFALAFPDPDNQGFYDFEWQFWCPEDTIMTRSRLDRVPYDAWARDGWINTTPGNSIDYDFIERDILAAASSYTLVRIGFDPWNAHSLVTNLMNEGLEMSPVRQGFASLNSPSKQFEQLVLSGQLSHGNNPVMRWMINNVATVEDPAGNIKPAKNKSSDKIDGVISSIVAIDQAVRFEGEIYTGSRGVASI